MDTPPADNSNVQIAIPRHVAIIMDGNGRWAVERGLARSEGHKRGADSVQRAVEFCVDKGIEYLTLYCFSSENWKRPQEELSALMFLLEQFMIVKRDTLIENNIRLRVLGRRDGIPETALKEMDKTIEATAHCTGLTLQLAINYGSRAEIVDACRALAQQVKDGAIQPEDIDENLIADNLYTAGAPDPDLLIRTANEMRISNYLLWQISYAEIWVTPVLWPDFDKSTFQQAIDDFNRRTRKYGGLKSN